MTKSDIIRELAEELNLPLVQAKAVSFSPEDIHGLAQEGIILHDIGARGYTSYTDLVHGPIRDTLGGTYKLKMSDPRPVWGPGPKKEKHNEH